MATEQQQFIPGARTLGAGSFLAVVFGIASVLFGGPTMAGAGVLAVIVGAVALLLAVGQFLAD